jgi:ribosomal protein S19E (S16A)
LVKNRTAKAQRENIKGVEVTRSVSMKINLKTGNIMKTTGGRFVKMKGKVNLENIAVIHKCYLLNFL